MNKSLINLIFGVKIKQARQEAGLSLSAFAEQCEISLSYVTEIEKGSKYPRTDKILKMAEVLGKGYDELVSIRLDPSLKHLETVLSSPLVHLFPFEEFGMDLSDLVRPFTRAPVRASSFLHSIIDIGRQYDMKKEDFLLAALRSYQEIHENYFQDLEDAAVEFASQHDLEGKVDVDLSDLREILQTKYGYQLDETCLKDHETLSSYRSIFLDGAQPKLLLNNALQPRQIKFLIARELGYQALKITERSITSTPNQITSFEQILNDFRASYFAGALLMPRRSILNDLTEIFAHKTWKGQLVLNMLARYDVTPEMLLYRFSELIPEHFGFRLHFLRFNSINDKYHLIKQLHMNNFMSPSGIELQEHICRRWLSGYLLSDLAASDSPDSHVETPIVGVQISEQFDSQETFLSIGFSRPLVLNMDMASSVMVGLQITSQLKKTIQFIEDKTIQRVIINGTCERCPLSEKECAERSAPPTILLQHKRDNDRRVELQKLLAELKISP